jgi:hypothetical protein
MPPASNRVLDPNRPVASPAVRPIPLDEIRPVLAADPRWTSDGVELGARERADSAERLARNRAAVAMMRSASWRRLARSVRTRLGRRPT